MILIRRIAQTNLQPLRLWLPRLLIIGDYSKFASHWLLPYVWRSRKHSNIGSPNSASNGCFCAILRGMTRRI